jgi:hypothetical protein
MKSIDFLHHLTSTHGRLALTDIGIHLFAFIGILLRLFEFVEYGVHLCLDMDEDLSLDGARLKTLWWV